eukprot:TRINITY_DN11930_c2_g1_i1.p2 TRINITY_DN11930_c2_g1~~TRINITY_DN11930_c2_g1_i1.p2  ORF type:complete len:461 (+),score=103.44 TRINITY_DN11930_c2_g1_i1:107-1489(+)
MSTGVSWSGEGAAAAVPWQRAALHGLAGYGLGVLTFVLFPGRLCRGDRSCAAAASAAQFAALQCAASAERHQRTAPPPPPFGNCSSSSACPCGCAQCTAATSGAPPPKRLGATGNAAEPHSSDREGGDGASAPVDAAGAGAAAGAARSAPHGGAQGPTEAAVQAAKYAPHGSVWECTNGGLHADDVCTLNPKLLPWDGRPTCDSLVTPLTAVPLRSPLVLTDYLASLLSGRHVLEVGSRAGDGAACLKHYAKSLTIVESNHSDCLVAQQRALNALCGAFPKVYKGDVEVIFWWVQQHLNNDLLEIVVAFDTKQRREMGYQGSNAEHVHSKPGEWRHVRRFAKSHAVIAFNECKARTRLPPWAANWCLDGAKSAPPGYAHRRKGSFICARLVPAEIPLSEFHMPTTKAPAALRVKRPRRAPQQQQQQGGGWGAAMRRNLLRRSREQLERGPSAAGGLQAMP